MADEKKPGGGEVDMFDSLGLKSPDRPPSEVPPSAAVPPTPPPPGAASNIGVGGPAGPGRMRAPAKTLLGIPGPANAKPVLGTTRPSAKLRAVAEAAGDSTKLRAAEARPIPPPPPRRGSLPDIELGLRTGPPGPPLDSSAAPTRPAGTTTLASADVDSTVDDSAATHIYDKSPALSPDESGMHLEGPAPRDVEHVSIEELLVAAPTQAPSERPRRVSGPAPPDAPPPSHGMLVAAPSHARSAPPPSSRAMPAASTVPLAPSSHAPAARQVPAPPSSRAMQAAAHVPQPPAPPPPRARQASSTNSRAAMKAASGRHATYSAEAGPATDPPPTHPPPPRVRQMVTTKLPRTKGTGSPMLFVLIAVMAGAAAIAFVLMPRSSTLVVNVADTKGIAVTHADVFVDGVKRCADTPCAVHDVAAGSHEVKVAFAGVGFATPPPRTISVDGRRDVLADFQLVASKGTGFKVTGNPGVKLSVDNKDVGVLPQEKRDLDPGEHKLHFFGDGYVAIDKTITVASGEVLDLGAVPLKVAKGRAILDLATPDAKVFLVSGTNRKEVPQLPMAIEFDPSEKWEIVATKDGFEDFHEAISFDDGQAEKTFSITLRPKASSSAPASPNAPLQSDAPPNTTTPPRPLVPAPPAPAPRRDNRPDDARKEAPAPAPDAETVLKINSLPASSIMLDGKSIGATPQPHVVVTPGSHTVTFVNSDLSLKKTITVDVKAGESKPAFARLRD